ncbi:MAG: hypothetical protein ABI548_28950 [Polyangiaceae bacterium]
MQQQIVAAFSPVAVSAVVVAIVMAASRLAPFTKPYWTFLPKAVQVGLPSLVAGVPVALNAFGAVKTWLDLAQALLVAGAIPFALAAPGMSSPHNDPASPPPPRAGTNGFDRYKPKPPTVPPLAAAGLFVLCLMLPGCGLFSAPDPHFAHAAVFIADAGNAVSAAEALLPSLNLSSDEAASAKELIARARTALSAAAAANNGAKDLSAEQFDASLAAFRSAWTDIRKLFTGPQVAATKAEPSLPTPICMPSAGK